MEYDPRRLREVCGATAAACFILAGLSGCGVVAKEAIETASLSAPTVAPAYEATSFADHVPLFAAATACLAAVSFGVAYWRWLANQEPLCSD